MSSEATFTLDAEIRTDLGKGASRRLRHADKVPAILYGAGKDPVSLTLDHNKVLQAQEFEAFYSHILTINVNGKPEQALLKDMQRHAFKPKVTHLDFLRVDATHKVTVHVPVHFVNEENCKAIKFDGGHAEHHVSSIDISCLPADLPEFIEVDVTDVEMGQTVHLSDLTLPKGVESVELLKGETHDQAVVTVKVAKVKAEVEDTDTEADSEEASEE